MSTWPKLIIGPAWLMLAGLAQAQSVGHGSRQADTHLLEGEVYFAAQDSNDNF